MLKQKVDLLMVSEDDFYKEIESSDDVELSNLKNDVFSKAKQADIVMFFSNNMTIVVKNRFGSEGVVV